MHSVRPKKNLGQHFLTDLDVARRIADTVDVDPALPILEVGPGMGVLTRSLLAKKRPLRVVEIDRESVAWLHEHLPALGSDILADDFLRMPLDGVFDGHPFVVTGNYPYDISSQIFFRVVEHRRLIPLCTGMIQLEVAQRLAALPGGKTYGVLSVLVGAWYDVEILFTVPPHVFSPPPRVTSAVVRLTRRNIDNLGCNEKLFRRVVKTVFLWRRKMLRVSLRQLLPPETLNAWGHLPFMTLRPEQLSIPQFVDLTNRIEEAMPSEK